MLRINGLEIKPTTDFHILVSSLITEVKRYDCSCWSVYGIEKLQDLAEYGTQQDSAEYLHKLIEVLGHIPSFTGKHQSGCIAIDSLNNWYMGRFPDIQYIRLPITIEEWNKGNFESTIAQKDPKNYNVDIQTPGSGPAFLFVTLNRFNAKNIKVRTRALSPSNLPFGGDEYQRIASLHHGGLQTVSGHYWTSGRCSISGTEFVHNDDKIYKQLTMIDSTSVYSLMCRKKQGHQDSTAKSKFGATEVFRKL